MTPRTENLFGNPNLPPGAGWDPNAPWNEEPEPGQNTQLNTDPGKTEGDNPFWPGLRAHQVKGVEFMLQHEAAGLFYDTGTGKTLVAIRLMEAIGGHALVVGPRSVILRTWRQELEKWHSPLRMVSLWARTKQQRLKALKQHADVYCINFEGFKLLRKELAQRWPEGWDVVIVDESSMLKSHSTQITKSMASFRPFAKRRYLMSGCPAPNSALEYWGQFRFLDPGILSPTYWAFRNTFFESDYMRWRWTLRPNREKLLMSLIREHAIFVHKEDCLNLPPYTIQVRDVEMTDEQTKFYQTLWKEMVAEYGENVFVAPHVLTRIMKLREVTAGFCRDVDGKDVWMSKAKINALKATLDEIGPHQVVIWAQFRPEIRKLGEVLGSKAVLAYGERTAKQTDEALEAFEQNKVQYLIAHPKTGGWGLNLQNAHYSIWTSISYSSEQLKQAKDRIRRDGQKYPQTWIFLLCPDTVDVAAYNGATGKEAAALSLLRMLKKDARKPAHQEDSSRVGAAQSVGL